MRHTSSTEGCGSASPQYLSATAATAAAAAAPAWCRSTAAALSLSTAIRTVGHDFCGTLAAELTQSANCSPPPDPLNPPNPDGPHPSGQFSMPSSTSQGCARRLQEFAAAAFTMSCWCLSADDNCLKLVCTLTPEPWGSDLVISFWHVAVVAFAAWHVLYPYPH